MTRSKSDDGRETQDGIDLPSSAYEYGVDATGATHYHSALARTVWVVEDGEIAHEWDVPDIQDYHAHVADTRGWADGAGYDQRSTGEWLADALAEMGVSA